MTEAKKSRLAKLESIRTRALRVLSAEGYSDEQIAEVKTTPIDPWDQEIERRIWPLSEAFFESWVEKARGGDGVAEYHVRRELVRWIDEGKVLPPKAKAFAAEILTRSPSARPTAPGRPKVPMDSLSRKWARAVLVCFHAGGNYSPAVRRPAMTKVAGMEGVKNLDNLVPTLRALPLWGMPPGVIAWNTILACRILMSKARKD